jgi:hypothetical protein
MAILLKELLGAAIAPKVLDAIKGVAGSGMLGMLPQKLADGQAQSAVGTALADNMQAKITRIFLFFSLNQHVFLFN